MTTIAAFVLALSMPAAAQPIEWLISSSSTAFLAAEQVVVYRGGPAGLTADASASSTGDVVVVRAEEKDGAWTWTVLPLSTGTISFIAHYQTADGRALAATAVFFRVAETDLPGDADISDIKPPFKARPALWPWLLAAALGYAGWRAWKRWQSRRLGPDGEPIAAAAARPPDVVAVEAIAALQASGLWERDQAAYYLRLTDILREYLEARYGTPATAMTSAEVARLVKARAGDLRVGGAVRELLNRADLVKFARAKPAPDDGLNDANLARGVIKDTTPRAEAAPDSAAAGRAP